MFDYVEALYKVLSKEDAPEILRLVWDDLAAKLTDEEFTEFAQSVYHLSYYTTVMLVKFVGYVVNNRDIVQSHLLDRLYGDGVTFVIAEIV